jgi:FMN-dependent oxidoreductase (nitrilotriacetate monooxygenase family)
MKLGARFFGIGKSSRTAWRHPLVDLGANVSLDHHVQQAQIAEAGKFDFIFMADSPYIDGSSTPSVLNRLEPLTILSAVAAVTRKIGLVGTVTTSFSEPYTVARQFASLDHISGGRAGWNVVTTGLEGAARNYGRTEHLPHDVRYRLAEEHLQVVRGLWDSWEDDAFVGDKAAGRFYDPAKLHELNHKGEFFAVQGPLNIARSRQGQPVIFQAGGSESGRNLAARSASAIYTTPETLEEAQDFYKDMKRRVADSGRSPDDLLIFPGISQIAGHTEEEARRKYREVAGDIAIEEALLQIQHKFPSVRFADYPLDEPFPDIGDDGSNGYRSLTDRIKRVAKRESLTLRETALRFGTPDDTFVGSAIQVADTMQEWFEQGAADGFLVGSAHPDGLAYFVERVIPILRQRNLFRSEYEHDTLRGNLGLAFPENRYSKARVGR